LNFQELRHEKYSKLLNDLQIAVFRKQVVDLEHIEKLADESAKESGNADEAEVEVRMSLEAQLTAQLEQQERDATAS